TRNIVIENNIVHDTVKDNLKVSQGDYIYVIDNRTSHAGDQGVDFVDVNKSVIARNDISYTKGPAALFAKGGSTDVLIAENKVSHASVDGIEVGGYSDMTWTRPADRGWEAKNVIVANNEVDSVGKRPLNIIGAQDVQITHNLLHSNPNYYYVVTISADQTGHNSKNITFTNNVFDRSVHLFQVLPGQSSGLKITGNHYDGVWHGTVGPHGGTFNYDLPWLPTSSAVTAAGAAKTAAPATADHAADPPAPPARAVQAADPPAAAAAHSQPATHDVVGTSASEHLVGTSGADTIVGQGGVDTLAGGAGNDVYLLHGHDHIIEHTSAGLDLVESWQSYGLDSNVEKLQLMGTAALDGTGNALANHLIGNSANNHLAG